MAKTATKKDGVFDTLKTIFWALLIAGAFRTILFQPFSIPSGSMKPELLIGDYLFVSKFAYGYSRYSLPFSPEWDWLFDGGRILGSEPERGDVVVFKHPQRDACSQGALEQIGDFALRLAQVRSGPVEDDCVDYVKRIVGLPGDRIQVKAGILHINGEALPTERVADFIEPRIRLGSPPRFPNCVNGPVPTGGACAKEQFVETFPGGRSHRILNIRGTVGGTQGLAVGGADNTPVFTVPEGHFFFMGDNRDNSVDSRFGEVGMVPFENLIGRADVVALSSEGAFYEIWNWRFDRFFKSID
ncbi:signal peptidase I [Paralimibaculum aggregatum]|uniref:Signal peptidase I n=1 Tax=Paralimibaculum aggregatum TaxID=3036245 RepID=A0ABQ6LEZ4_9RHOB|nr:signal peptidase I [Limibaculum sp. NKW23]GMG80966.1 signal peptidase I [Limibaculum sp. NKW23]